MVNRVHDPEPGPDSLFQELVLGVPVQCVAADTKLSGKCCLGFLNPSLRVSTQTTM